MAKNLYDQIHDRLVAEGRVHTFTDEENLKLMDELSEGMPDFLQEQRVKQSQSELELKKIILI